MDISLWWHNSSNYPLDRAEVLRVLRRLTAEMEDEDRQATGDAENVRTLKIRPRNAGR